MGEGALVYGMDSGDWWRGVGYFVYSVEQYDAGCGREVRHHRRLMRGLRWMMAMIGGVGVACLGRWMLDVEPGGWIRYAGIFFLGFPGLELSSVEQYSLRRRSFVWQRRTETRKALVVGLL